MVTTQQANPLYAEIAALRELLARERAEHAVAIDDWRGTVDIVMKDLEIRVCQVNRLHAALADRVGIEKANAVKREPRKGNDGAQPRSRT